MTARFSASVQSAYDMLEPRQRKYVEARLNGLEPRAAARSAGYSASYAGNLVYSTLERNPVIKVILRESGRAALKNLCLTRESVLHGLMDAVDTSATATELTNAWREIGRVIGAYEPEKIQIDVNNIAPDELRTMPLHELAALADMQGVFDGEFRIVTAFEEAHAGEAEGQGQAEAEGHARAITYQEGGGFEFGVDAGDADEVEARREPAEHRRGHDAGAGGSTLRDGPEVRGDGEG